MTAPSAAPSGEELKTRIISHMNRDHTRELGHYLRHYAGLSARAATSSPSLRDVNLQGMLINANGIDHEISFSPPLASWSEARPRIIAMDATAREALGISDIYITAFAPPRGFGCVVFGSVLFYFVCAASLPWIEPGSALWDGLAVVFPGGPEWFRWVVRVIFVPILGIHTTEAVLFDRWRMQKHGVARWSSLWWLWVSSCFVEGVMAWRRIDGIIAEKRKEREAKKD